MSPNPAAWLAARRGASGGVDHQSVSMSKQALLDLGYDESEIQPLDARAKPDGYAVVLPNKDSSPVGYWITNAYIDEKTAIDVAARVQQKAHVRAFRFID